jgi:outer membrane protein X
MKKCLFALILVSGLLVAVHAEDFEYKPFRVDLGLGYAIPKGGGGVAFQVEPKYSITPQISAGIRWQGAIMARNISVGETTVEASAQLNSSWLATGDYHFTQSKFRPYAGLGLGVYPLAAVSVNDQEVAGTAQTNFGFLLRAGFDISHFRLGVEYDFAGKDAAKNSAGYFAVTANVIIGGGRRK